MEQMEMGSGADIRQATACNCESSLISLYGVSFLIRMPTPPTGLLLLSRSGSFEIRVYCLLQKV